MSCPSWETEIIMTSDSIMACQQLIPVTFNFCHALHAAMIFYILIHSENHSMIDGIKWIEKKSSNGAQLNTYYIYLCIHESWY